MALPGKRRGGGGAVNIKGTMISMNTDPPETLPIILFYPMASFLCQILTHVLCFNSRVENYFVIEPKNSKKQIRPGKHGN